MRTTQLTLLFLREPREKQRVSNVTFLVDTAAHLEATSIDSTSDFACAAVEIETLPNVSFVR
jgi:hypothetical protein